MGTFDIFFYAIGLVSVVGLGVHYYVEYKSNKPTAMATRNR